MFRYKTEMEACQSLMLLGDTKSQRGDNQRMGSMLWISIVGRGAFGKEQETKLKRKAKSILRT